MIKVDVMTNYDRTFRLAELIALMLSGEISDAQREEINSLTGSLAETDRMMSDIMRESPAERYGSVPEELRRRTWEIVSGRIWARNKRRRKLAGWISGAAAAVIAAVLLTIPLWRDDTPETAETPGVVLMLANGEEIILSGAGDVTAYEGLTVDSKNNTLFVTADGRQAAINNHTLIVPARNVYNITLSDGSEVILNANSKLVFPAKFEGEAREVRLEGEAYFSVKEDPAQPFTVRSGDFSTTVIGTEFSVTNYAGDRCVTTLVSGKVSVDNGSGSVTVLTPGQQAQMSGSGIIVSEVDTYYYTAWKDGYFIFDNEPLSEVVRRIADWYGMDYRVDNRAKGEELIRARIERSDDPRQMKEVIEGIHNVIVKDGTIIIK